MKSYEQRTENITKKAKRITVRRRAWITATASLCLVAIVCGVVFLPTIGDNPPNIYVYKDSDYFPLIEKLNEYNKPNYQGNINLGDSSGDVLLPDESSPPTAPGTQVPDGDFTTSSGEKHEETTLNQVAGVAEGDILKRSTNYAYYLKTEYENTNDGRAFLTHKISVYSLKGEASALIGEYVVRSEEGTKFFTYGLYEKKQAVEMYLSEDAKTLTVFAACTNKNDISYTCIVSLDVSEPSAITEKARAYVAGRFLSARKVNEEFLLITNFTVPQKPDYDNPDCFIPTYGTLDEMQYLQMDGIYLPDKLTDSTYTVVAKIDENDLKTTSIQAALSYTRDVAVSENHIFVCRNRVIREQNGEEVDGETPLLQLSNYRQTSEIVCINYQTELKNVGCIQLDGGIVNRYGLDEKDGILRVVTQTNTFGKRNASLFCVDLSEMKVVGSVENFAPNGETVESIRFDGDKAYVCTAVKNTDPVFVFDLSDVRNIPTPKNTGVIPGYSFNLLKFGNNLLGIGYGDSNNILKIEVYEEGENDVHGIAQYEVEFCQFSEEYKSHFVDSERCLVGLQITDYNKIDNKNYYLLLQFDGAQFHVLLQEEVIGANHLARAFYDDGFYLFGEYTMQYFPLEV